MHFSNNTEFCSDSNGSSQYKCICNEGFDGIHCEHKCPLETLTLCEEDEICISEIDSSYQKWECISEVIYECKANLCCENGPNPLCCQNGVCSNENFVFNATTNNANECQCLCTSNFAGLLKYSHHMKGF